MRVIRPAVHEAARTLMMLALAGALGAGLSACGARKTPSSSPSLRRKIHVMASE